MTDSSQEKTRESKYIICSLEEPSNKVSRLLPALSPLLISISVSSAHLFRLLHAQPAQLSISDVLFLASACTASILALVSSQLNRAQLSSGHGMTGLPIPVTAKSPRQPGVSWVLILGTPYANAMAILIA